VRRWILALGWAVSLTACGHEVTPTKEYSEPESIPLCCTSDGSDACCGLVAYAFSQGIEVTWNSEGSIFTFIDGWLLYRATGDTAPPDSAYHPLFTTPYTYSQYRDAQIVDGVRYWYRLSAVSPAGVESVPSDPAFVRADFTPPLAPTGLSAVFGGNGVELSWDASSAVDLDHYNVFRAPDFPPFVFPQVSAPHYVDPNVVADSTYTYWVTAVDQGLNESAPSETVVVRIGM
jgi:fibronectin type 3 domain-containing protein